MTKPEHELTASELIERAEELAGRRWDDPNNPNGLAAVFGAVARAMGKNPHQHKDDVAAGTLLLHQMTPEYRRQKEAEDLMAQMLTGGMSPDDLGALFGKKSRK